MNEQTVVLVTGALSGIGRPLSPLRTQRRIVNVSSTMGARGAAAASLSLTPYESALQPKRLLLKRAAILPLTLNALRRVAAQQWNGSLNI